MHNRISNGALLRIGDDNAAGLSKVIDDDNEAGGSNLIMDDDDAAGVSRLRKGESSFRR